MREETSKDRVVPPESALPRAASRSRLGTTMTHDRNQTNATLGRSAPKMPTVKRATVLAVEDDPIVRADLRLILEDANFVVSEARDGIEAVERAREDRPDLILLDLGLPKLDGVAAARQILRERAVPIVVLTGRSNTDG